MNKEDKLLDAYDHLDTAQEILYELQKLESNEEYAEINRSLYKHKTKLIEDANKEAEKDLRTAKKELQREQG
jgi:vacuolar-type H+-ATPase subunit H